MLDAKALKNVHVSAQRIAERLEEKGFKVRSNDLRISLNASELDFKALYKLKEKLKETSLKDSLEWVHFALTSEDTNNLAYAIMLSSSLGEFILPSLDEKTHPKRNST